MSFCFKQKTVLAHCIPEDVVAVLSVISENLSWFNFMSTRCDMWHVTGELHWTLLMKRQDIGLANSSPLDKMAVILADAIFKYIFLNRNDRILVHISLKYIPRGPIDKKATFVQIMTWRRTGDKPLPEPMMTQFIDAYMRH